MELDLHHCFGLHGPIRDNILVYQSNDTNNQNVEHLMFPVGNQVVDFLNNDKTMKFFRLENISSFSKISLMCLSQDAKYLGICSESYSDSTTVGDGTQIRIYSVSSHRKVKTLFHRNIITAMCFSDDSKQLIMTSEESLLIWSWEKEKIEYTSPIEGGKITRIRFPPSQTTSILTFSTSGPSHLRLWIGSPRQRIHNSLIMQSQSKEQKYNFVDHTWLMNDKKNYQLLVVILNPYPTKATFEERSTVMIYKLCNDENTQKPVMFLEQTFDVGIPSGGNVLSIASFKKSLGFYLGGSDGYLGIFEKKEDRKGDCTFQETETQYIEKKDDIIIMKPGTDDDKLYLFSDKLNIYVHSMSSMDTYGFEFSGNFFDILNGGKHYGGIIDCDICDTGRPLFVTCSDDCSIRMW